MSQAAHPYPSMPHPTFLTPRVGPQYFPPNALQVEDMECAMELLDPIPSPQTPRSPAMPTPVPHMDNGTLLQTKPLVFWDFDVVTSRAVDNGIAHSGLANSIHSPNNSTGDQTMSAPQSPTLEHVQTTKEQAILAHLALAETNRSILSQNGPNHHTILPQFTPTPTQGFPTIHMSHSAQIFNHLDNRVLLTWFQVEHPKFMVCVFDLPRKEVAKWAAIIAEWIRASIATIAEFGQHEFPTGFLVHKISVETMNPILHQHIWSAADITFEAIPFNCVHPPEHLFCLSGFTTFDIDTVLQTITDVWSRDENRQCIDDIFSKGGFSDDELVYKATRDLIKSARVKLLNFKVMGGLSVPHYNMLATSPTNDAQTWTKLRSFLHTLKYPTNLDGCGAAAALFPCQICHSLAHP
ncbi:hypothetical protein BDR03DRAFT_1014861 [Suillus americanus]|nr:hypothetical protein BDR03DRAFT_1014861 [Suillus americanus]